MKKLNKILVASLLPMAVIAGGGHDGGHEGGHEQSTSGHGGMQMGGHKHSSWETPPPEYVNKINGDWNNQAAAERGSTIYTQQCSYCHGADGKGTGPAAAGLAHPPADLTNHFHTAPGKGDGYLFWRISEGGVVEPFRSMKSAMPAFKAQLSEEQRWDLLTYVHKAFHGDFPEELEDEHKAHNH